MTDPTPWPVADDRTPLILPPRARSRVSAVTEVYPDPDEQWAAWAERAAKELNEQVADVLATAAGPA